MKNFSYTAFMHLGSYEKHWSDVDNVLRTFEDKRDILRANNDTAEAIRKSNADLVAAVVMFRLHVHYSVQLKSFSTPMKCRSCQAGLCKCSCHNEDTDINKGEDVSCI